LLAHFLFNLPEPVQTKHLQGAPGLGSDHMPNGRLYPNREAMLHALPKGGIVAEVGTWRGSFSERIAAICGPKELHLLDIDFSPLNEGPIRAGMAGRVEKHLGDSASSLAQFPENYFDWMYIDGDHTYEGVVKDLAAAHRVLKRGGHLMCNDYTNWDCGSAQPYGVARAVNELCLQHSYTVEGFAFHGTGYPDILLRKP
jgi:ubiquinone/menaquinone biosynthesis C-methylase UbiE